MCARVWLVLGDGLASRAREGLADSICEDNRLVFVRHAPGINVHDLAASAYCCNTAVSDL